MKLSALALAGGLVLSADAFWRMECSGRVGLARIDPLMAPGEDAQHAHSIHGSSGFSATATYEDLMNGDCTSCEVVQDKSAYWHPSVYFRDATTGTYEVVEQKGGMLAYYLQNKNPGEDTIASFPKGFRMIAGDATRRNYSELLGDVTQPDPQKSIWAALGQTSQADLKQRALGFNCMNYGRNPEPSFFRHYMPDKDFLDANCANGLRFELMFPSCWNGKDLDSPNHQDHVAYPELVIDGQCPESHPTKMVGLMYETIWAVENYVGRPGEFVLSHGDVKGFGYHGDFMMGWDENFLRAAVEQCTAGSGRISDCPLFTLQGQDKSRACHLQNTTSTSSLRALRAMSEDTLGPGLPSLPGNVQIQYGPQPATMGNASPVATSAEVPTQPSKAAEAATTSLSGQVFHGQGESSSATPPAAQEVSSPSAEAVAPPPATTPAPSPSEEVDGNFKAVSTQYITVGNVVSKIVWAEEVVYVTEYEETTSTVTMTGTSTVRPNSHARRHLRELREHARHHY